MEPYTLGHWIAVFMRFTAIPKGLPTPPGQSFNTTTRTRVGQAEEIEMLRILVIHPCLDGKGEGEELHFGKESR